jgi:hypothetical protein
VRAGSAPSRRSQQQRRTPAEGDQSIWLIEWEAREEDGGGTTRSRRVEPLSDSSSVSGGSFGGPAPPYRSDLTCQLV